MSENFCSEIIETMKCFALENFNLSCQAQHTKINSRLNFNPGLALIAFWTTRPRILGRVGLGQIRGKATGIKMKGDSFAVSAI